VAARRIRPRATSSTVVTTATPSAASPDQYQYLSSRRLDRVAAAQQHADERTQQRHQTDGAGLVHRGRQRLGRRRPRDQQSRVPFQQPQRRLVLAPAAVQLVEGAMPSADSEAALLAYCSASLSRYKCPRSVDFVDELPRDDNGKLYKRLLRERYWQGHTSLVI